MTASLLWFAGVLVACGVVWKSPVGRGARWVWSRLIGQPLSAAAAAVIRDTVAPMVDEVKAAARHQHDEQNGKLDVIKATLSHHGQRLTQIEDHVTKPRERM